MLEQTTLVHRRKVGIEEGVPAGHGVCFIKEGIGFPRHYNIENKKGRHKQAAGV